MLRPFKHTQTISKFKAVSLHYRLHHPRPEVRGVVGVVFTSLGRYWTKEIDICSKVVRNLWICSHCAFDNLTIHLTILSCKLWSQPTTGLSSDSWREQWWTRPQTSLLHATCLAFSIMTVLFRIAIYHHICITVNLYHVWYAVNSLAAPWRDLNFIDSWQNDHHWCHNDHLSYLPSLQVGLRFNCTDSRGGSRSGKKSLTGLDVVVLLPDQISLGILGDLFDCVWRFDKSPKHGIIIRGVISEVKVVQWDPPGLRGLARVLASALETLFLVGSIITRMFCDNTTVCLHTLLIIVVPIWRCREFAR